MSGVGSAQDPLEGALQLALDGALSGLRRPAGESGAVVGEIESHPVMDRRHYPAMPLPGSDEPASISQDEARQELFGRGPSKVGMEVYEVVAIVLGIVGAGIAVETIDSWAQWVSSPGSSSR